MRCLTICSAAASCSSSFLIAESFEGATPCRDWHPPDARMCPARNQGRGVQGPRLLHAVGRRNATAETNRCGPVFGVRWSVPPVERDRVVRPPAIRLASAGGI
jgi:hypothetical protein